MPTDILLTAAETAIRLNLTPSGVRRLCRSGVIRASQFGGSWAIPESEIARAKDRPKPGKRARLCFVEASR